MKDEIDVLDKLDVEHDCFCGAYVRYTDYLEEIRRVKEEVINDVWKLMFTKNDHDRLSFEIYIDDWETYKEKIKEDK